MCDDGVVTSRHRDKERSLLDSLRFSLETGCCAILKNKIARYGADLANSGDPDTRAQYARILVEAEAEVPRAMAEAFRGGQLGILDYYKLQNVQADTDMRVAIAGASVTARGS